MVLPGGGTRYTDHTKHMGPAMAFGIPRRSLGVRTLGVNDNERTLIDWRRGLFRVWVLLSAAWMMGWTIFLIMHGLQGGIQTTGDVLEIPVVLFGPPIALLLFGVAAGWAFRGFKAESGPPGR